MVPLMYPKTARVVAGVLASMRCTDEDGQVVWEVDLPPGPVDMAVYSIGLRDGEVISVDRCQVAERILPVLPTRHPQRHETGANPDWKPTAEWKEQRRLDKLVADLEATKKAQRRLEERENARVKAEEKANADKAAADKAADAKAKAEAAEQADREAKSAEKAAVVEEIEKPAPEPQK